MCVLSSVPSLCNFMDCSQAGSSVHGIFQARILEWVAISYFKGPSQPKDQIWVSCVSCISRQILYHLGSPKVYCRAWQTRTPQAFKQSFVFFFLAAPLGKAMVFLVVMYECESWTIKNAECRRIDAFELWCWRTLLRVPWTARRSNQSILKEISPGCSLEGLMLKLKLQYFGHLMQEVTLLKRP